MEPNIKIALLTLLVLAVAAVAFTFVLVLAVDRSTEDTRASSGEGGEERESE